MEQLTAVALADLLLAAGAGLEQIDEFIGPGGYGNV